MGALPYGNPSEIDALFARKHAGDKVTKAELFGLKSLGGLSVPQQRKVISYCEETGYLVKKDDTFYYKRAPVPSAKPEVGTARTPLAETPSRGLGTAERQYSTPFYEVVSDNKEPDYPFVSGVPRSSGLDPKTAYEFFDPNRAVFRGIVVTESGWDFDKDKSLNTAVEVLFPEGYTRFGLVSSRNDYDSKKLLSLTNRMKKGELVLVRRIGEFPDKRGEEVLLFEPLLYLTKDDNVTLNGESIRTVVEAGRILHLPIVEPGKERGGLLNGVGYVPEGFDVVPVYVDGAGSNVWTVVPEVSARKISSEKDDGWGMKRNRIFYIGELPMTATEKAMRQFQKVDPLIEAKRRRVALFELNSAVNGETDDRGRVTEPGMEKVYIMVLGAAKPAREAGLMYEFGKRKGAAMNVMSLAAAKNFMAVREREIIKELHKEGSDAHKKLMADWPSTMEAYIRQAEERGRFAHSRWEEKTPEQKKEELRTELRENGPFYLDYKFGVFAPSVIRLLTDNKEFAAYLAAAGSAFNFAASRIESTYDWRQRFSMDDFLSASGRIISEDEFWRAARTSFGGVDVPRTWKGILEELKTSAGDPVSLAVSSRIVEPYIEHFAQKVS